MAQIVDGFGNPVCQITVFGLRPHELDGIQLLPEVQGRGIGTAIIEALKAEAAETGATVELGVEKDNPNARRLYHRLGFVEIGETDDEHRLQWPN